MATNPPAGDGHRNGAVRDRSQFKTPAGNWAKRAHNGRIMDVKTTDKTPFKGVRREREPRCSYLPERLFVLSRSSVLVTGASVTPCGMIGSSSS